MLFRSWRRSSSNTLCQSRLTPGCPLAGSSARVASPCRLSPLDWRCKSSFCSAVLPSTRSSGTTPCTPPRDRNGRSSSSARGRRPSPATTVPPGPRIGRTSRRGIPGGGGSPSTCPAELPRGARPAHPPTTVGDSYLRALEDGAHGGRRHTEADIRQI